MVGVVIVIFGPVSA